MLRPSVLVSLSALLLAGAVQAQAAPGDTSAIRREVEAQFRKMEEAFNRGDILAAASYYTDDAVVRTPDAVAAAGRNAVDAYFTGIQAPKDWRLEAFAVGGPPDAPFTVGRSVLRHGNPMRTSVVRFLLIWRRDADGQLRIALDYYHAR